MLTLDRAGIARLIPHAGAMCLLDGVVSWDTMKIRCVSHTHHDAANPLRAGSQLHVVCGIEYAAQAMAVHGGLAGNVGEKPKAGYLASVREVACRVDRLDDLPGELVVEAERLMGDATRVVYRFMLWVGGTEALSGRATVVLDAAT